MNHDVRFGQEPKIGAWANILDNNSLYLNAILLQHSKNAFSNIRHPLVFLSQPETDAKVYSRLQNKHARLFINLQTFSPCGMLFFHKVFLSSKHF